MTSKVKDKVMYSVSRYDGNQEYSAMNVLNIQRRVMGTTHAYEMVIPFHTQKIRR